MTMEFKQSKKLHTLFKADTFIVHVFCTLATYHSFTRRAHFILQISLTFLFLIFLFNLSGFLVYSSSSFFFFLSMSFFLYPACFSWAKLWIKVHLHNFFRMTHLKIIYMFIASAKPKMYEHKFLNLLWLNIALSFGQWYL